MTTKRVHADYAVSHYRRFQERELRTSQLETQVTKARLKTLKSQLQFHFHFLFNTLHSISGLMLTKVPAPDKMKTPLTDLLRGEFSAFRSLPHLADLFIAGLFFGV
jgi:sensor histidine kinase YesM